MIKSKIFLALIVTNQVFASLSEEFFYPVAYNNATKIAYIIHQKSLYSIDLWIWDKQNESMEKGLLSTYSPGGLKLLPDNSGFSFIDQGKLRIKHFYKRSPKTINFYEPIYDMGSVEWIDSNFCYFTAKKKNNLSIFHADIENQKITCLQEKKSCDCMYPQKVKDDLFFVERTSDNKYKIIKTNYLKKEEEQTAEQIIILNNGTSPIAFLNMKSESEGFFISHPEVIDRQDKAVTFSCFHLIINADKNWQSKELFSFVLPINYIFGTNDQRLYESILPFLPK